MLHYINGLKWEYSFSEFINNYTESFGILYNSICMYLVFIAILISFWLTYILKKNNFENNTVIESMTKSYVSKKKKISLVNFLKKSYLSMCDKQDLVSLEATWSIIPISFIGAVSVPSIGLEYGMSPDVTPFVTVKVIGHQWYWQYEIVTTLNPNLTETVNTSLFTDSLGYKALSLNYTEFLDNLESLDHMHLKKNIDISIVQNDPNFLRLLSLDNKLVLPMNVPIKFIITSVDVIHSFTIPSAVMKMDAIPGRLSEQVIIFERPGLFWGQCSELCGPYHGFMPILVEVTTFEKFLQFMLEE